MTRASRDAPEKRRGLAAVLLFLTLFAAYHANWTVLDEGDAVPSANLPAALLSTGKLSFDPENFPELFKWKTSPPFAPQEDFFFTTWKWQFADRTASDWAKDGHLTLNGPRYYIVPSALRRTYVSTFGPIPGLVLLPFVLPFYAVNHDVMANLPLRDSIAKLCSSTLVALTAVLLFFAALRFTTFRRALVVAFVYGLGTCAWGVSSQNMWQQTVDQFFIALGTTFFLAEAPSAVVLSIAGLALGAATACRVTSAFVLLAAGADLYFRDRRKCVAFALGGCVVPFAIAIHNQYYFGNPFAFAQSLVGHQIALQKTGSPSLWQTPLWLGALGLLVSPSRGLLVFSPVLGLSFWGMFRAFRDPKFYPLRPFVPTALLTMATQCKWFDWWGGHTYGYRPWMDVLPHLALFLLPVIDAVARTVLTRVAFGVLFAWSVFVQAVGAFSYDRSWNFREIFVVRLPEMADPLSFLTEVEARRFADTHEGTYLGPSFCDVDLWFCRPRLWSVKDNEILYQLTNFSRTRGFRLPETFRGIGGPP